MKTTHFAALAFAALSITGITAAVTTGDVTHSPRTVIQAEPAPEPADEPCPFPYPMAICAPIPPAPVGMTDEEREELADEYSAAWAEIEVGR